jgi:hypothetical protein
MLDCFGYKCLPLEEVPPVVRLHNKWPVLQPELWENQNERNWEGWFPMVKCMYEAGAYVSEIAEEIGCMATETVRKKINSWTHEGRLVRRKIPKRRAICELKN